MLNEAQDVNFTLGEVYYIGLVPGEDTNGDPIIQAKKADSSLVEIWTISGWHNPNHTIYFGTEPQFVSEYFLTWVEKSLVLYEGETISGYYAFNGTNSLPYGISQEINFKHNGTSYIGVYSSEQNGDPTIEFETTSGNRVLAAHISGYDIDTSYTMNFGVTPQPVSTEFMSWVDAVLVKTDTPVEPEEGGVGGEYTFKNSLIHADTDSVRWDVNFTCNGKSYTQIYDVGIMTETYFITDSGVDDAVYYSGQWQIETPVTINIAPGQELPDDFIAWLNQNTVGGSEDTDTDTDTVSGTWYFNEQIIFPEKGVTWNVNFTTIEEFGDEVNCTSIYPEPAMTEIVYGGSSIGTPYASGWQFECYRTITIAEGQDLGADFIAWLKANAVKQGSNPEEPDDSNTWVFNESLTFPNETRTYEVNFTANGTRGEGIYLGDAWDMSFTGGQFGGATVYSSGSGWQLETPVIIIFDEGQELPADLIEWLNANATKQSGDITDISGQWVFNEYLTSYSFDTPYVEWNVNFTHDGTDYNSMTYYDMGELNFGSNMVYSGGWSTIDAPNPVIDIAQGQEFSAEFITWLKANATKAGSESTNVSGDWVFHETLTEYSFDNTHRTWDVNFTHDGTDYTSMTYDDGSSLQFGNTMVYSSGSWTGIIDAPNPVITIAEGQTLSTEFVEWLTNNATHS